MPPPGKEPLTFLGWVEDVLKFPVNLPKKQIAVYVDEQRGTFKFIAKSSSPSIAGKDVLVSAAVESPEAFKDLPGVNTTISIEDYIKKPFESIQSLGKKTLADVFKIDDVAADRRGKIMEALTKGETTVDGTDISKPQNQTVRAMQKLGFDFSNTLGLIDPVLGKSKIQLIKADGVGLSGNIKFEDRKVAEENENRETAYKTYTQLAGHLDTLAGSFEVGPAVTKARDGAVFAYNRTIMRELGVDLDKVLPTEATGKTGFMTPRIGRIFIRTKYIDGAYYEELKKLIGSATSPMAPLDALEKVLTDDNLLAAALSLNVNDIRALNPGTRKAYEAFLKAEFRPGNIVGVDMIYDPKDPDHRRKLSTIGESATERAHKQTQEAILAQFTIDSHMAEIRAQFKENEIKLTSDALIAAGHAPPLGHATWTEADLPTAPGGPALITNINDKVNRKYQRIETAIKSMDVAHNLYFAATTKNLLEAVEKGSFLNTFFISSRFAGTLPFVKSSILDPKANPVAKTADRTLQWLDDRGKSPSKLMDAAGFMSGFAFEGTKEELKGLSKLTALESQVTVEWKTPTGPTTHVWHQKTVGASQGAGLFGDWGILDTVDMAYGNKRGPLINAAIPTTDFVTPDDLLNDPAKVRNFFDQLIQGADDYNAAIVASPVAMPNPGYESLAKELGLTFDPSTPSGKLRPGDSIIELKKQYAAYTSGTGGEHLLFTTLAGADGVQPNNRYLFLKNIVKQGKDKQFISQYMGVLNWYNRKANAAQSFVYKQILFGNYGGSNALVKGLIKLTTPLRSALGKFSIADETILIEAIGKWGFVDKLTKFGNIIKNPGAVNAFASVGNVALKGALTKIAGSAAGKVVLQSLGYILSGTAGALTGGISWLVTAFGDVIWKFGSNTLKGDFKGAIAESKKVLQKKVDTIKKVLIYPLACGCGCIMAPFFLIVLVISSQFAPLSPFGGGNFADIQSEKISITKSAVKGNTSIAYTLVITNISDTQEVTTDPISDTLTFTYPCGINGESTITYDGSNLNVSGNFPDGQTVVVQKGTPITIEYTVNNIIDGTYHNLIDVSVPGETGRSAFDSVSTDIGVGGCITCPEGWPFGQPLGGTIGVTQGPGGSFSHTSDEAVDLAPAWTYDSANGQLITATHSGTVWFSPVSESGGYGNLARVVSDGGFSTLYAHMQSFNNALNLDSGDRVDKGTVLGIMGKTGNSHGGPPNYGVHLHYEFRSPNANPTYQCIPGHPLKLINITGSQRYVPVTIPVGCVNGCGGMTIQ